MVAATGHPGDSSDAFVWVPVLDPGDGTELGRFGFETPGVDERAVIAALVRQRLLIAGSRQPLEGGPMQALLAGFRIRR